MPQQLEGRVFQRVRQFPTLPMDMQEEVAECERFLTTHQDAIFASHHASLVKTVRSVKGKVLVEKLATWLQDKTAVPEGTAVSSPTPPPPASAPTNDPAVSHAAAAAAVPVAGAAHAPITDALAKQSTEPTHEKEDVKLDEHELSPLDSHGTPDDTKPVSPKSSLVSHAAAASAVPTSGAASAPLADSLAKEHDQTEGHHVDHKTEGHTVDHHTTEPVSPQSPTVSHGAAASAVPMSGAAAAPLADTLAKESHQTESPTKHHTAEPAVVGDDAEQARRHHAKELIEALVLHGFLTPYKESDKHGSTADVTKPSFHDSDLFVPLAKEVTELTTTTVWQVVKGATFAGLLKRKAGLLGMLTHGKDAYVVVNEAARKLYVFESDVGRAPQVVFDASTSGACTVAYDDAHFTHGVKVWTDSQCELFNAGTKAEQEAFVDKLVAMGCCQGATPHKVTPELKEGTTATSATTENAEGAADTKATTSNKTTEEEEHREANPATVVP